MLYILPSFPGPQVRPSLCTFAAMTIGKVTDLAEGRRRPEQHSDHDHGSDLASFRHHGGNADPGTSAPSSDTPALHPSYRR